MSDTMDDDPKNPSAKIRLNRPKWASKACIHNETCHPSGLIGPCFPGELSALIKYHQSMAGELILMSNNAFIRLFFVRMLKKTYSYSSISLLHVCNTHTSIR